MTQALDEFEVLFRAAKSDGGLDVFLASDATSAIDAIACERAVLTAALLRWLPDNDMLELAEALCQSIGVHYLQARTVVQFDLKGSDPSRAEAVALRLVAHNCPPAMSLGWLLGLSAEHGEGGGVMKTIAELMRYHVDELPVSTEKLLANESGPLAALDVARNALAHLRELDEYLKGLPEAPELFMPMSMRLMYASMLRRRNREINAGSEKRSLFASMFKSKRFKYSTRTAHEIHLVDRTEEQTMTMAPISISMELPISDATDAVAANVRRNRYEKGGAR